MAPDNNDVKENGTEFSHTVISVNGTSVQLAYFSFNPIGVNFSSKYLHFSCL